MEKKNPQCLRNLKCFKKLTKTLLVSLSVRFADTITRQALHLKAKAFMLRATKENLKKHTLPFQEIKYDTECKRAMGQE